MRDKLNESTRAGLKWLSSRSDDFKIDSSGRLGRERANLPSRGLCNPNLRLANACRLFVGRNGVSDESRDLELLGRLLMRE